MDPPRPARPALGSSFMQAEFEDVIPQSPASICLCGVCTLVNFILIILFFPCTITQLGQFKYGIIKNKVTGYVNLDDSYEPGRYWIGFWKEFIEFPSTLNTIEFSNEKPEEGVQHLGVLHSRDKDKKQIALDISIQYRLGKGSLGKIYRDMLTVYEDIYISELRDQLSKAANKFGIQEAWENYPKVSKMMLDRCIEVLASRHAECWGLQLWGVALTNQYQDKLIQTQVRKQAKKTEDARKLSAEVRAKTQVVIAEYRKNITITQASGEADKYLIEKGAIAIAQANFISAQAKAISIVKDKVCPLADKDITGTGIDQTYHCTGQNTMTGRQLVNYQKMKLLQTSTEAHMIYNMKGGSNPVPMNVAATRDIMSGKSRRLLLHEGKQENSASNAATTLQDAERRLAEPDYLSYTPGVTDLHEL